MIELDLLRDDFQPERTLGRLLYNGDPFGYVCEDPDRGLMQGMTPAELFALKVRGVTCIAAGYHPIVLEYSPKYGPDTLTIIVPGHRLIRIHTGNDEGDSNGCLCPGLARTATAVQRSTPAVAWLKRQMVPHLLAGGEAWIRIHRDAAAWAVAPFNPERK